MLVLTLVFGIAFLMTHLNVQDEVNAVAPAYQDLPDELVQYERYAERSEFYWMSFPFLILTIYLAGLVLMRAPRLNFRAAFLFLCLSAGVYLYYALNGATAPNTAAHMHLVLVPLLWGGGVGLPFSMYMLAQIWKTRARAKRAKRV
jgi:hypothetical protein